MKFLQVLALVLFVLVAPAQAARSKAVSNFDESCDALFSGMKNNGLTVLKAKKALATASVYNAAPDSFMPTVENAPWAANYFPMEDGGIASRYKDAVPELMANYTLLNMDANGAKLSKEETLQKIKAMSQDEIDALSPTEKYDILRGDFEFSATRWELQNRGPQRNPAPEGWEGFCNAMRAAGLIVPEPVNGITRKSKNGVTVNLDPADVKALIGATYFYVEKYAAIATPHQGTGLDKDAPNPGAFHIAMNHLALSGEFPIVIDVENKGSQLWNEAVVGYERSMSEPKSLTAAEKSANPNATQKVKVEFTMKALAEIDLEETNGATKHKVAAGELGINEIPYEYHLYIDDSGKIQGGKWLGTKWPDFLWFPNGKGTDAENGGNTHLDFPTLLRWTKAAADKGASAAASDE